MRPVLFSPTATAFTSQGLGVLTDAISCEVVEERNGAFELSMTYPIEGERFHDIQLKSIILAKPNPTDAPQPFRVYEIQANMGGTVTVSAAHLSYDMSGIPVQPFTAPTMSAALTAIKANAVVDCPFTLLTDKTVNSPMNHSVPSSMRSMLGGTEGSLLDLYGGEWKYDTYNATLMLHRGEDNGVVIKYGKNLTDLEQEKNCAESWTGVYPYWVSQDGLTVVQLPERIIRAVDESEYTLDAQSGANILTQDDIDIVLEHAPGGDRILMLNLSQESEEGEEEQAPTVAELREKAQAYITRNDIFSPKVSLKVKFEQLESTEEYKDLALLETVNLCDTVTVVFPALGVSSTAKVVKTTYDVLLGRYESVEIGSARTNIADTIATMQSDISSAEEDAYSSLNATGGSVSGDLYVGGALRADGSFRSGASNVQLAYPAVWQYALGTMGSNTTTYTPNGLRVDLTERLTGWYLTISGTPSDSVSESVSLRPIAPFTVYGWLVGESGAYVGDFELSDGVLTINIDTVGTCFAQTFLVEEIQ